MAEYGISLEGMMLKLKLQYFGHLMRRVDSLEKTLILRGIGGRRRRGRERMRWLDGITDSMDVSLSELRGWWWTGRPGVLQFTGSQKVGHDWATDLIWIFHCVYVSQNLYPFICWRASRLIPNSSYCKEYYNEPWEICVFFNFGFLRINVQEWDSWVILVVLFLVF